MPARAVLIVDGGGILPAEIVRELKKSVKVKRCSTLDEAAAWLADNHADLAVLVEEETARGLPLLLGHERCGHVVVLAPEPSLERAKAALRAGVTDYLEPPFSLERLAPFLPSTDVPSPAEPAPSPTIIGTSAKMKEVYDLIRKVCNTDSTVLIRGESGTGKELIAQALHYQGARREGPFVAVNCGAIPAELLESELFGHEKGAFTHAIRTRLGRFELAHGGTVFLDEISEMSPLLQVKLLRVLQERQFERIGGTKTIVSDFRVVAATNRDLEEEVKAGRFREDLYYRLNVIPIEAPPLRERREDIPLLIDYFITRFNRARRKKISGITDEAMQCLLRYPWPGNVRELENTMERMVILASGTKLDTQDLPDRILENLGTEPASHEYGEIPDEGFVLSEVVADFEKRLILKALSQTGWVKNRAAKLLNVNRTTLIEKMKRFGLTGP